MIDPKRIWSSSQLPTLPAVAVRLVELSKNDETEIRDVVQAIKADPALSAKLVKAANSTYFGIKSEVKAIERAVPLLGTTVSTSLALSFSLSDAAMTRGPVADHFKAYWKQSIVQAAAAEALGTRIAPAQASEFFLCGLLQDIGRLAMLKTIPQEYLPVLESVARDGVPLAEVETAQLGFDHVEIGAKLLEYWKLPEILALAVRLHHANPGEIQAQRETPQFAIQAAAAVAASVGDYFCTAGKGRALERLRQVTAECFQFDAPQLEDFLRQCDARIDEAAGLFNVDVDDLGDPAELMEQANEQLAQLALREHAASTQASQRQQEVEQENQKLEVRNRELQKQALHDPLTGIYNRQFFEETLEREAGRCQRTAAPLGVLFIDLDNFKQLNDTYGHQFGDTTLQRVSRVFQSTVRSSDVLARYGGEEFVVLVGLPAERGLERLAERIRQRVEEESLRCGDEPVPVTCSIGAALTVPQRCEPEVGKRLIAAADSCLYDAKRAGRNCVRCTSLVSEADRKLMREATNHRFSRWLVARRLVDVPTVSRALLECSTPVLRMGELAVDLGYMDAREAETITAEQEQTGERFGAAAMRLKLLTWEQLVHMLSLQQEDPKQLAGMLIRLGLLAPEKAAAALEEYLIEVPPLPAVVSAVCV